MSSHEEHINWCKKRALELVKQNDLPQAVTSMMSDLTKHESTNKPAYTNMAMLGLYIIREGKQAVIDWINGFN